MKKILFLIHDLGHGGAEKVLVNLVNNMDRKKFDITVIALFGGGINERFLLPHIHYRCVFRRSIPGNSHIMKLFSPGLLHRFCVKEHYDIEISYLEGPSARVISGCESESTKLVSWIHGEQHTRKKASASFRSYAEAHACYSRFDYTVGVSQTVKSDFLSLFQLDRPMGVLYNTNETDRIRDAARECVEENVFCDGEFRIVGVGKVCPGKGFDRLARIHKRLRDEGYPVHTYILGVGPQQREIEAYLAEHDLQSSFTFLGYQTNPYKYMARSDLFVCASHSEGFSTAATEALIVGTPVCTTDVSGMKEMLGEDDAYGIVTRNDEQALYQGIRRLLDDPALLGHYRRMASERGDAFCTEHTVRAVEQMLERLVEA